MLDASSPSKASDISLLWVHWKKEDTGNDNASTAAAVKSWLLQQKTPVCFKPGEFKRIQGSPSGVS